MRKLAIISMRLRSKLAILALKYAYRRGARSYKLSTERRGCADENVHIDVTSDIALIRRICCQKRQR